MEHRTVKDILREEYFSLLPEVQRVLQEVEITVKRLILPVLLQLDDSEQILVTTRIKECESAIEKLIRKSKPEGATYDAHHT